MAVQIVEYGLAWNVAKREGRARLRGKDGKTWNSPPLDATEFAAYEAVLRSGASADQGWLLSGGGHEIAQIGGQPAFSGESPFPW
jgi:hypothetical protein